MIIDELVLQNFGVYRGRQEIDLTPPSPDQPVVLIGGLNGGGKTTFLDALKLVLFGKHAKTSNRGRMAYADYLERCMHRGAPPEAETGLELAFRSHREGEEHSFRVCRRWTRTSVSVSEDLVVYRNGERDEVLSDSWLEFVEEFIPSGVSHLFFFDGEKIKALADVENSSDLLSTAIQSLLGLDLVDQLETDLVVLERRKKADLQGEEERRRIEEAEEKVSRAEDHYEELVTKRGQVRNELGQRKKALKEVEARYRREGGELLEQRDALEAERATLKARVDSIEDDLRVIAAGSAPLLVVQDLVEDVAEQASAEATAHEATLLTDLLRERDGKLLQELNARGVQGDVREELEGYLQEDRETRAEKAEVDCYLGLTDQGQEALSRLRSQVMGRVRRVLQQRLAALSEVEDELLKVDRKLAAVPERDAIATLMEERRKAQVELEKVQSQLELVEEELERAERELEQRRKRLTRLLEKEVHGHVEQRDLERIVKHSERVRETLGGFRERVVRRHLARIEKLVLDSFRTLVRKQTLVEDLEIDPTDFTLSLRKESGEELEPQRLSAGERQLLAVSLLWGLARASGRPLPAVIDTPLGRLDSSHRTHLVERYFPHASHQVLLLSTDEEFDEEYYEKLEPWIGHEYILDFDDALEATQVRPGYFWEEQVTHGH